MRQTFFTLLSLCAMAVLSGCGGDMVLFNSKGQIGVEQGNLILIATALMLIVVIPAIFMTFWFVWKYRESNKDNAEYLPDWSHSTKIEIVVWAVPIAIICVLAVITYKASHSLDPYKPLTDEKIASSIKANPNQTVAQQAKQEPITIQVIAEQWKWVFVYPELNIATINQIVFPVNTPVKFEITSNAVMNSFFIPELGGQIYAMAGMRTKLHLIADELSDRDGQPGFGPNDGYRGISANYSGYGFAQMRFRAHAVTNEEYAAWVDQVRASGETLDMATLRSIRDEPKNRPTKPHPVTHFSSVEPAFFQTVMDQYMPSAHGSKASHQSGHAATSSHTPAVEE